MMKKFILIIGVMLVVLVGIFFVTALRSPQTPSPVANPTPAPQTKRSEVLIAPGGMLHKNSAPGLKGITDTWDMLTENGMNVFAFTQNWNDLEPSPGTFNLHDQLVNPLTILVPKYPQLKGVVFVLKMIDTNWRPMPADLATKSFNDPQVLKRFDALIDAIAAEPSSKRITHILLGNEIDGYLNQHPHEYPVFLTFYERAVNRIHQQMPGVKVGTIFTFQGVGTNPPFFDRVKEISDFIDYTYYPVGGLQNGNVSPTWQMRPVGEIAAELNNLAQRASGKPFAFTEIGYSSSPFNNSSEEKQAEFVQEMFRVLTPYREQGRIAFLLYHAMYDYAPGVCRPYAKQQGASADVMCDFMENLGLRSYETGAPRKAWDVFVTGVKKWNQ